MKIIRSSNIKIVCDPDTQAALHRTICAVHNRASEFCEKLLSMRGNDVLVREGTKEVLRLESDWITYQQQHLRKWNLQVKGRLAELYQAIVKTGKVKGYISPLFDKNSNTGKIKRGEKFENGKLICRELLDKGILPFSFRTNLPRNLDYAAWQIACEHIKSWDDRNQATLKNHMQLKDELNKINVNDQDVSTYLNWKQECSIYVNEKLLGKFNHFGFDIWYCANAMQRAKIINSSVDYWQLMFAWDVAKQKLDNSRKHASFTFPDANHSIRKINFGYNYCPFFLVYSKEEGFTIETSLLNESGKEEICELYADKSNYYQNLKVTPVKKDKNSKNMSYLLEYDRGSRQFKGVLKELLLHRSLKRRKIGGHRSGKHSWHYYFYLPLDMIVPDNSQGTQVVAQHKIPLSQSAIFKNGDKVLSVDLNLRPILAMCLYDGGKKVCEFKDGEIKCPAFYNRIKRAYKRIEALGKLIDYLKNYEKPLIHEKQKRTYVQSCDVWGIDYDIDKAVLRKFILDKLRICNQKYKEMRRENIRQTGICAEQLEWIKLVKSWTSIRKKWTYFNMPPLQKFATRDGFEKETRYLANIKADFIKKAGSKVAQWAMKHGASVILIEDLQHFRMSVQRDTDLNELLHLWSPLTLQKWIKHFAEQSGIEVVSIDPRHTSQVDAETQEFGYRNEYDKTKLHVIRQGQCVWIDSDTNAAENLQKRFFARYANPVSLKGKAVIGQENTYLIEDTKNIKDRKTSRLEEQLKSLLCTKKALIKNGQLLPLKEAHCLKTSNKIVNLYKHKDHWLDYESHKAEIQKIRSLALKGEDAKTYDQNTRFNLS